MTIKTPTTALPRDVDGGTVMQVGTRSVTNHLQKSPLTVSSVEQPLDIPANCYAVVIQAKGADLRISMGEGGTAAAGTYDICYDGNTRSKLVSGWPRVFLLRNASTDVTVTFEFWVVGTVVE